MNIKSIIHLTYVFGCCASGTFPCSTSRPRVVVATPYEFKKKMQQEQELLVAYLKCLYVHKLLSIYKNRQTK